MATNTHANRSPTTTRDCGGCGATIDDPAESQTVCYRCMARRSRGDGCDHGHCELAAEHCRKATDGHTTMILGVCETHRREIERSPVLEVSELGD